MAGDDSKSPMQNFFDLIAPEFDEAIARLGWPRFRADQIRRWVYQNFIDTPERMSNLSKRDRADLSRNIYFSAAKTVTCQVSADGTVKLLLSWPSGANAETVMIPDGTRRTACISSQIGCPVGCKFCASGIDGVKGNLSAGQIVEQVFALSSGKGFTVQGTGPEDFSSLNPEPRTPNPRISNIVFMGMGEPLANYANVMKAVRILHDPKCFNIGARKITISTVGVPSKMRQLAHEDLPLNLAISLHAPNEKLRRELIPWAEHFALDDILDAARYYFDRTGREITLEYILLAGVNDQPQHARELAQLCKTLRANVNLIRYNEVPSLPYARPKSDDVMNFQSILRNNGVNAHVRKSRGRDIDAACGQLRRQQEKAFKVQGSGTDRSSILNPEPRTLNPPPPSRGFTLAELIVLIVVLVILLSIFVPYLSKLREDARRVSCVNNLKTIFAALQHYAHDNGSSYPATAKDAANPGSYTAFTGADDPNPFARDSSVRPNDVTASLWLLVRGGYVKDTGVFMCPSVATQRDLMHDSAGRGVPPTARGNFRRAANVSYSYASPFSASAEYKLTDTLPHDFAIMADKNPGANVNVPFHAGPSEQQKINSANHGGAGENVLYAAGYVVFQWTPYCAHGNDNIYTAQSKAPPTTNESVTTTAIGAVAPNIGPATATDSYLLPTQRDGE